jgi:hypothetical protein
VIVFNHILDFIGTPKVNDPRIVSLVTKTLKYVLKERTILNILY